MRARTLRNPANMPLRTFSKAPSSSTLGKLFGEIGYDGTCASGNEHGHVMSVKNLRRFNDQRNPRKSRLHHTFPEAGRRQQRGHSRAIRV